MTAVEITDKEKIGAILSSDRVTFLEAIDENVLGMDGIVSVFTDAEASNVLAVRWAQSALGLRHEARLSATRLSTLDQVFSALPRDRGAYDLLLPFWASGAAASGFLTEVVGARAIYSLEASVLKPSPVARQCVRVTDQDVLKSKFRKLAEDSPAYVLSLRDQLTSVAVVTHLRDEVARIDAYTVEEARGRGFGRGVLTALCEELLAMKQTPTVVIDLGHEASVRMVESIGFRQTAAFLSVRMNPNASHAPDGGLVKLGSSR